MLCFLENNFYVCCHQKIIVMNIQMLHMNWWRTYYSHSCKRSKLYLSVSE